MSIQSEINRATQRLREAVYANWNARANELNQALRKHPFFRKQTDEWASYSPYFDAAWNTLVTPMNEQENPAMRLAARYRFLISDGDKIGLQAARVFRKRNKDESIRLAIDEFIEPLLRHIEDELEVQQDFPPSADSAELPSSKTIALENSMPEYYHVRVSLKSDPSTDAVANDLSLENLLKRIVTPYSNGMDFVVSGTTIRLADITKVKISKTQQNFEELLPQVQADRRASGIVTFIPDEWEVAALGRDVTNEFILGPAGYAKFSKTEPSRRGKSMIDSRKVFVVHGRNERMNKALFSFLRSLNLQPLEWNQVLQLTGKATPELGEILDSGFSVVQAVVVLFTPDDEAQLKIEFRKDHDPEFERQLTGQPRPNVLYEAGMAFGRHPDRTVLMQIGQTRPISDTVGKHVLRFDGSPKSRQSLVTRLKTAGCTVNSDGTDWLSEGDFTPSSN